MEEAEESLAYKLTKQIGVFLGITPKEEKGVQESEKGGQKKMGPSMKGVLLESYIEKKYSGDECEKMKKSLKEGWDIDINNKQIFPDLS